MAANNTNSREARLAAALKENLRRRKLQAREKAQNPVNGPPDENMGATAEPGLENMPRSKQKSAPNAR